VNRTLNLVITALMILAGLAVGLVVATALVALS
jgi:hypothetical protein